MEEDKDLLKNAPHFIKMQGMTSTSENYRVALNFISSNERSKHKVLFVFVLHNYRVYDGFRMNTSAYSAHPEEKEILLCEGCPVAVMGTEDILIDNSATNDPFWAPFNNRYLTVIYLFHAKLLS